MSTPLRVLMFSDHYGGITTTFIRNEARYFAEHHCFKYLTLDSTNSDDAIDVKAISFPENVLQKRLRWSMWKADLACTFKNRSFAKELKTVVRDFVPDVIHCQFAYEGLKILQNIGDAHSGPIFIHFHGYDASQMIRKKSYIRALNAHLTASHVTPIVVSDYMRSQLAGSGLDMSQAKLLRCGIDLSLFSPTRSRVSRSPGQKIVFAQISSLIEKKGQAETMRALRILFTRNPEFQARIVYRIAGNGDGAQALRDLARTLNLDDVVEFIGPISPSEAVGFLDAADVFVHHSIVDNNGGMEGIPTAIMEAMAMELPILSTRHAGIPELVEHGVNGLLCEERDLETYSRQMEEIATWSSKPENRLRIEKEYNKTTHNTLLESLYRQAITRR